MKKALLISVQGIGNTVLMTPSIVALREIGYAVDVVVSDNGSKQILRLCPDVGQTYVWRERASALGNLLRLRAELRRQKYDVAYALYPNGKRENALLSIVRASSRSRYAPSKQRGRLLDFLPPRRKLTLVPGHDTANNHLLIQQTEPSVPNYLPRLSIDSDRRDFAAEFFARNGLSGKFVVALHPGGGGTAKAWSQTKYVELCTRLAKDPSIAFLVCGSPNEASLVDEITQAIGPGAISVCTETIDRVAALLANCRLLIANDSALAHIASALEVPVVTVWGYTDFRRVAPVNEKGILVRIDYSCNPCYEFAKGYIDDCQYHLKCIKDISVDQIHRIVSAYISALKREESLRFETLNGDFNVSAGGRLDSGCFKIDLMPPQSPANIHG